MVLAQRLGRAPRGLCAAELARSLWSCVATGARRPSLLWGRCGHCRALFVDKARQFTRSPPLFSLPGVNPSFTNEMLQQHFNNNTFKLEEQIYVSEGIKWTHIDFIDNQPMIELITAKRDGVRRCPCLALVFRRGRAEPADRYRGLTPAASPLPHPRLPPPRFSPSWTRS